MQVREIRGPFVALLCNNSAQVVYTCTYLTAQY